VVAATEAQARNERLANTARVLPRGADDSPVNGLRVSPNERQHIANSSEA
jgi:hypothetical protein